MHHPTDRITSTTAFWHWLEREIAQWVHSMKERSHDGTTSRSLIKDHVPKREPSILSFWG